MDCDITWLEVNARLRETEAGNGGLTAVLTELEAHQRETGFIKDDLSSVERHVFHHPDDGQRFFRVQYNPRRALRFYGAGVTEPPAGASKVNGGCFLCRENIRWQQRDTQVGFEIRMTGDDYHALMNPFPLMPNHFVLAADDHITQEWDMNGGPGLQVDAFLLDLCSMARRMPSHIGYYNGVEAGATIPGHLHFQFFRRPEADPVFPLEHWDFKAPSVAGAPAWAVDYPVPVARWQGPVEPVVNDAAAWVRSWAAANKPHVGRISSNFIAAAHGPTDGISLYFVPRDRTRPGWDRAAGLVGGVEILGELVFSTEEGRKLLEDGVVDYFFVEDALAKVRPPAAFFE